MYGLHILLIFGFFRASSMRDRWRYSLQNGGGSNLVVVNGVFGFRFSIFDLKLAKRAQKTP